MIQTKTIKWLSEQQFKLDQYIMDNQDLKLSKDMLKKKVVAFLVEMGEYANEERSFKYWSKKAGSAIEVQLDEYIDGIHFIISIGNQIGFDFDKYEQSTFDLETNVDCYLAIVNTLADFITDDYSTESYEDLLDMYLEISNIQNYSEEQIVEAYKIKNKVNFERQDNNY